VSQQKGCFVIAKQGLYWKAAADVINLDDALMMRFSDLDCFSCRILCQNQSQMGGGRTQSANDPYALLLTAKRTQQTIALYPFTKEDLISTIRILMLLSGKRPKHESEAIKDILVRLRACSCLYNECSCSVPK
jgi:hypothetical protein